MWPIGELHERDNNPRTHSEEQIAKLADLMREFGFWNPILIEHDGTIICGHGRRRAALRIGLAEIPCIVADGWTPAQIRAYVIADNKIALDAGWDEAVLKAEFTGLMTHFDLKLTAFSPAELKRFTDPPPGAAAEAEPEEPEAAKPLVSKRGDVWICGTHQLIVGKNKPNLADMLIRQWQAMTRRSATRKADGITFAEAEKNART